MKMDMLERANQIAKRIKTLRSSVDEGYAFKTDNALSEAQTEAWDALVDRQEAERREMLQGFVRAAEAELEAL